MTPVVDEDDDEPDVDDDPDVVKDDDLIEFTLVFKAVNA